MRCELYWCSKSDSSLDFSSYQVPRVPASPSWWPEFISLHPLGHSITQTVIIGMVSFGTHEQIHDHELGQGHGHRNWHGHQHGLRNDHGHGHEYGHDNGHWHVHEHGNAHWHWQGHCNGYAWTQPWKTYTRSQEQWHVQIYGHSPSHGQWTWLEQHRKQFWDNEHGHGLWHGHGHWHGH